MLDDKIISNKDYTHLTEDERRQIETARKELDPHISAFLQKTRDIELATTKQFKTYSTHSDNRLLDIALMNCAKNMRTQKTWSVISMPRFRTLDNLSRFLPDESDPGEAREALKSRLSTSLICRRPKQQHWRPRHLRKPSKLVQLVWENRATAENGVYFLTLH